MPVEDEPRTHYHYSISLRLHHPAIDPEQITKTLGINPERCWKAREARSTPRGTPLAGVNESTYWVAKITSGRWPLNISDAIHDALTILVPHRSFLHHVREEGGVVELFIGWFFENQSGEVLTHQCLTLAGDLQIDLSFDVYSPKHSQPISRAD